MRPGPASSSGGGDGLIVMRLRALDQLFDPVDPSPFGQQDLSQWAAEYIVESVKEMSFPGPLMLKIVVASPATPAAECGIASAVRRYFAQQASLRRRALRRLLRRGLITLAIGMVFLVAFFGLSRLMASMLGDGPLATLLREGSLIVGWVAMWRPIEIFLYDWWPIVGERRFHDRLSRIGVQIASSTAESMLSEVTERSKQAAARAIQRWENEGGRVSPTD